jgi:hypothetical protein
MVARPCNAIITGGERSIVVPGPFDTTTKDLFNADPAGWLRLAGLMLTGQVEPVDVDLATIGLTPDKVARVDASPPSLNFRAATTVQSPSGY